METTEIQKTVDQVLAEMQHIEINDQESYEEAASFLRKTKQTGKTVKDHFEPERKRTHEAYKAVTDQIKFFTDKLSKAERTVKQAMGKYVNEQERKRREVEAQRRREEEEKRLQSAIETGHDEVLDKPIAVEKEPEAPKVDNTYTVEVWKYQIQDVSKINPDYLIPDEKAIGALVRSKKGDAGRILGEGVRVYSEKEVRSRL